MQYVTVANMYIGCTQANIWHHHGPNMSLTLCVTEPGLGQASITLSLAFYCSCLKSFN